MNWLAHLLLSPSDIHARIGNLAADIVRQDVWAGAPEAAAKGLRLHTLIDAFTDGHAVVRDSVQRLGSTGRLRPVVVDIAYDHVLARRWDVCMPESLDVFAERFFEEAFDVLSEYPDRVQTFIQSIHATRRLTGYVHLDGIEDAMLRLDERLSERVRQRERTHDYFGDVVDQVERLEEDFFRFFPELCDAVMASDLMDEPIAWRAGRVPVP